MFQRIATCTPSLRAGLRLQTLVLCICLIAPLTWRESGFDPAAGLRSPPSAPSAVAGYLGGQDNSVVRRNFAPPHLPASLTPAPGLALNPGLRSGSRDGDSPPAKSFQPRAVAGYAPGLFSPRIDPVAWDSGTPSFLLPSAHGLVSFAMPPPLCLG